MKGERKARSGTKNCYFRPKAHQNALPLSNKRSGFTYKHKGLSYKRSGTNGQSASLSVAFLRPEDGYHI